MAENKHGKKPSTPKKQRRKKSDDVVEYKLTEKQEEFCRLYVLYRNTVKAYQEAFQCAYKTARGHAHEMWEVYGVRETIDAMLDKYRADIDLDLRDIYKQHKAIAYGDIGDYIDLDDEGFVNIRDLESVDSSIINEIKPTKFGVGIKMYDKQKSLQWLGEFMKYSEDEQNLRIEKQKLEIEKLKAEIDKLKGEDKPIENTTATDEKAFGKDNEYVKKLQEQLKISDIDDDIEIEEDAE